MGGQADLAQAGGAGGTREVRPFAFGDGAARPPARLAGLERIGDRLARHVRTIVEPLTRSKTQVTIEAAETMRFEAFRAALPQFTSLGLYRMRPLKGSLMVVVDPGFVTALVDSYYGGRGSGGSSRAEFTPTEERLAHRLSDQVAEKLGDCWQEIVPLQLQAAGRETNASYAALVRPDESVVVQRISIAPVSGMSSTIAIVYPLASLRPVESLFGARVHDSGPADTDWRERLSTALAEVQLPVRSVLARPELSVQQLMALKPGDVIPITLPPHVPLAVAGRRLAYGTIGEQDGRAAMVIERIGGQE